MLSLLLSLIASTAGETAAPAAACVLRPQADLVLSTARLAPAPGVRHEDQAASRRSHVPAAAVAAGVVPSPERRACALYEPPSLAPLTASATPSSQRDPPLSLG